MQYTTKEVAEKVGRAVATVRNTIVKLFTILLKR